MKNSTLSSIQTKQNNIFYCCCESLKGNAKLFLVFLLFMVSFSQGVSAQGTLVPACNLTGPLEACAASSAGDTSKDIIVTIDVARSGAPNLLNATTNLNFTYSFPSNSSGAFIRSYGNVIYTASSNSTQQTLVVCPGTGTPEFNLRLIVTNSSSSPNTFCECSKSVSVSKVAATITSSPILCAGRNSDLEVTGSFSDVGTYTYLLLPSGPAIGPTNLPASFSVAGSTTGIIYDVLVVSAEGCRTTVSTNVTEPAFNPVVLT